MTRDALEAVAELAARGALEETWSDAARRAASAARGGRANRHRRGPDGRFMDQDVEYHYELFRTRNLQKGIAASKLTREVFLEVKAQQPKDQQELSKPPKRRNPGFAYGRERKMLRAYRS